MSSLYIHIPFCKQSCYYCDFHFSTNLSHKKDLVDAICKEIQLQKDYLSEKYLKSIYFGGGTPSILTISELNTIFETMSKIFVFDSNTEITLEANPDDLTTEKIKMLSQSPVNRLSIGTQSFHEPHLRYLHRVHSSNEAEYSIKEAQDAGFSNISIDLIYAIPSDNHLIWEEDIQKALNLNIQHISAYCLTIEQKTVFGNWLKNGKITDIDEEFAAQQFEILLDTFEKNHFIQYEISNFCREGFFSQHNSNYWKKGDYLGIGPSAHSYNQTSRQFNIAHNIKYITSLQENLIPYTIEFLDWKDQINEYLMTSLRTMWGCDLNHIREAFNLDLIDNQKDSIQKYMESGLLFLDKNTLKLSKNGKLLADKIASDLFIV